MRHYLFFIPVFFILLFSLWAFPVMSQSQAYKDAMKKNLSVFHGSKSASHFIKAGDGFEAIAVSEKKEWLAYYYAGLCDVLVAFEKPKTDIDAWCDKAEQWAHKADSLSPNNSEVAVLRSMIAAARIVVNQKTRGQKYGALSSRYANEAIQLNDSNPRAYLLKGRTVLNTPALFGGGAKKAKPLFEKSLEKYKAFKPESPLHPDWGKEEAQKELQAMDQVKK